MSVLKATLVAAFGFAVQVASHGHVIWVECGGKRVPAFNPYPNEWQTTPTCSWRDHGIVKKAFMSPSEYRTTDINCHVGATPADLYVDVVAGETCTIQWTPWPESHHGPVISYLGACNGDCAKVNLDDMEWNKIAAVGQTAVGKTNSDAGVWGADLLRQAGNQGTVTIPKSIKAGNYICRHEIIALMGAVNIGIAQNYPNCIHFRVSGAGTDPLASGTKGVDLYTPTDPGIKVSIYGTTLKYQMPGPPLYAGNDSSNGGNTPEKATFVAQVSPDQATASPLHSPLVPYVPINASVIPSFTPSATGVMPSISSQPTGITPSYKSKVYQSSSPDSAGPYGKSGDYTTPKVDVKKSYTKSGDYTTPKVDGKVSRNNQLTGYNSKTADKDVSVPDGASATQLLDIIDRCVRSLRKLVPNRRRHARDVVV
ncbi:hypothetical protein MMC29_007836 [Sticta canariensis]|nr:hypothetical protein [Sticta canariensis]